jgi:hypothetical protein
MARQETNYPLALIGMTFLVIYPTCSTEMTWLCSSVMKSPRLWASLPFVYRAPPAGCFYTDYSCTLKTESEFSSETSITLYWVTSQSPLHSQSLLSSCIYHQVMHKSLNGLVFGGIFLSHSRSVVHSLLGKATRFVHQFLSSLNSN